MGLQEYRKKRNFNVTNEPVGAVREEGAGLRFCVQRHAARAEHFDLRLEYGGVALSWAVPKGPSFNTKDKRLAMRVEDHPVDYMSFEGTIPQGEYGGGTVMLWDEGEWIPRTDPKAGLDAGSLKFCLRGKRLRGDWALVRMKPREGEAGDPWLLIKEKDAAAKSTAGIGRLTRSVRSERTMAEIAAAGKSNPFWETKVMLAQLTEELPSGMGWVYELKYDGHRVLSYIENGAIKLVTRNGHDCTNAFAPAAEALKKLFGDRAAVVDGEMVVVNEEGLSDFGALQAYARHGGEGLAYVLFDLLALDGTDQRSRPLLERKEKLRSLLKGAPPVLAYSSHTDRMTKRELGALRARGVEGIVIKRADAPYSAGKSGDWLKLKFRRGQEFVIGGYTRADTGGVKALLVGVFEGETLRYTGRVGTGFSDEERHGLLHTFRPLECQECPFERLPKGSVSDMVWLKPVLAAQVDFAEETAGGLLRQASFKGLRTDKPVREIIKEAPQTEPKKRMSAQKKAAKKPFFGVAITHPEKQMFSHPALTKGALAEYYAAVAPRMMPYLKDRFLSVLCCPSGVEGERFFRRHLEPLPAGIGASEGDGEQFFYARGEKGILSLVQYNAVELHVWGSRRTAPDRPDVMVFDLDPDESLSLSAVRTAARELKGLLDELGLVSFLKTSGGKGYHIVVPFRAGTPAEDFRAFAKRVAELMVSLNKTRYTATMSKSTRSGKVFIDWMRNSPSATSAAPYSVRARENAPVSMPIAWEELAHIAPASVTLRTALKRIEGPDPWAEYFSVKSSQRLKTGSLRP